MPVSVVGFFEIVQVYHEQRGKFARRNVLNVFAANIFKRDFVQKPRELVRFRLLFVKIPRLAQLTIYLLDFFQVESDAAQFHQFRHVVEQDNYPDIFGFKFQKRSAYVQMLRFRAREIRDNSFVFAA